MNEEAFLSAIRESPDDPFPRLAYADWLEEQGDRRAILQRMKTVGLEWSFGGGKRHQALPAFQAGTSHQVWLRADKAIYKADADRELHEFSLWCVARLLQMESESHWTPCELYWEAIEVKRDWLAGRVPVEQLKAIVQAIQNTVHLTNEGLPVSIARRIVIEAAFSPSSVESSFRVSLGLRTAVWRKETAHREELTPNQDELNESFVRSAKDAEAQRQNFHLEELLLQMKSWERVSAS